MTVEFEEKLAAVISLDKAERLGPAASLARYLIEFGIVADPAEVTKLQDEAWTAGVAAGRRIRPREVEREMLRNAVATIARVDALANEASQKGKKLQKIHELKWVGNAYVGMSERIRTELAGDETKVYTPGGSPVGTYSTEAIEKGITP